ncbi:hypothetical protein NAEGRDRAFT_80725 [Naegleria gruberi]|uniref:Uncharacterized protein n=1 Tax=Naegleria gruberi TaxID=5762 RepID=D2VP89_NAEGR|nr:uncharacterized protein NAEGRDRAFT_80725 [Naegleria gruberi]EFC41387.1 hypothetical protein NAEGRDRAFT_80725 [Naegleria gruberi]|eukprot:XP_002674131.1 hypothetical protein NAEGRDRAFT_80725 [Naegleria gruberi strain NEG-M]
MLSSVLSPPIFPNSSSQSLSLLNGSQSVASWNPNTINWFSVVSGRDVYYYKIDERILNNLLEEKPIQFDTKQEFTSISTTSLQSEALCSTWSPEDRDIHAVGLSNGSILFDNVQSDQHVFAEFTRTDPANRGKTSSPPCRCIDWNSVDTNLIAAGYDKVPKQNCVAIWDVNRLNSSASIISDTESTVSSDYGGLSGLHTGSFVNPVKKQHTISNSLQLPSRTYFTTKVVTKPLYELCPGEGATSISWIPGQPSSFLLGTSLKYIRLFDLREYASSMKTYKPPKNFAVHNKSVLGIHFNPFDNNQFATYSEDSVVKIWDMRKMPNPVRELNIANILPQQLVQKAPPVISQVQWSTSHKNVIGVLTKDSNTVKLCDLSEQSKSVKYKISNHKSVFSSNGSISSFSFHPTIPRCLLLSTSTGTVQYTLLKDFVKFSISCNEEIVSAHYNEVVENDFTQSNDIMSIMKERAKKGIGVDVKQNIEVSKSLKDTDGMIIWSWINKMKELNIRNDRQQPSEHYYTGIQAILDSSILLYQNTGQEVGNDILPFKPLPYSYPTNINTAKNMIYPPQSEAIKFGSTIRYQSPQRSICLHVCGWDQEYLSNLKNSQIPADQLDERSVAIAIFNLDIKTAANVLGLLSDNDKRSNYMFLAYALGGYNENRREEFQNVYKNLYPKLKDPYLSAAFGFLLSEPRNVDYVLDQKAIPVSDRIAFACYYLNDIELGKYISSLKEKAFATADIQGLIITGLQTIDSFKLMQQYVDRTGDVQTACLAFNRAITSKFSNNVSYSDIWMENYRDLLDRWKMWEQRAFLDISIQQAVRGENIINHEGPHHHPQSIAFSGTAPLLQPSVSIKCAFCSQSLHHSSLLASKGGRQAQLATKHGNTSSMPKTTSCPSCRKPLPKCAVCLMSFGSPSHSMGNNQTTEMDFCFSWCTRCKHGGHVKHLVDWFKHHDECPVSDCKCKCFSYL